MDNNLPAATANPQPYKPLYSDAYIANELRGLAAVICGEWKENTQDLAVNVLLELSAALKFRLPQVTLRSSEMEERLKEAIEYAADYSSFRGHRIARELLDTIRTLQAQLKTSQDEAWENWNSFKRSDAELSRLRAENEGLGRFIRSIFGPKYDAEILAIKRGENPQGERPRPAAGKD